MRKIRTMLLCICVVACLTACGESESNETADNKEVNTTIDDADSENENIIKGTAKDEVDLTGTYEDEETGEKLVIIQDGDKAAYWYCDADYKEKDCEITDGYISGDWYYISRNMDGTLAISSGSGGSWGNFKRIDKYAEISFEDVTENEYEEMVDNTVYPIGEGFIVETPGSIPAKSENPCSENIDWYRQNAVYAVGTDWYQYGLSNDEINPVAVNKEQLFRVSGYVEYIDIDEGDTIGSQELTYTIASDDISYLDVVDNRSDKSLELMVGDNVIVYVYMSEPYVGTLEAVELNNLEDEYEVISSTELYSEAEPLCSEAMYKNMMRYNDGSTLFKIHVIDVRDTYSYTDVSRATLKLGYIFTYNQDVYLDFSEWTNPEYINIKEDSEYIATVYYECQYQDTTKNPVFKVVDISKYK